MSRRIVLIVSEDDPPDRLDHFLGANAPELSRTRAKEIIAEGLVTLNGAPAKPSARVVSGDVVEAEVPEAPALNASPEDIPLDVVYEDDDVLVVDKPAGMVVHPAPGSMSGTLVNALLGRGGGLSASGRVPQTRHRPSPRPRHIRPHRRGQERRCPPGAQRGVPGASGQEGLSDPRVGHLRGSPRA